MPHLVISLFGPLLMTLDGAAVSGFTSKKAQALLAYLAVEAGRPHSREELAGLLWPDYPEASARTNLRSVLANVRTVLDDRHAAPPFLAIVGESVQFNRASDQQVDVDVFDRPRLGGTRNSQAIGELEAAVAKVQGPFMAGFSLSDSPPFEEWMLLKREYFDRQVAAALQQLAGHWLERGAFAQALAHAERWAALEPWQEEAHQQVMRILAQSGRRSEALKHFETCRRILSTELGLEPGEETIALADRIRRGELPGAGRAARRHLTSRHLPLPLTSLVGRATEVMQLGALLSNPQQRLVTIVGPGGMGKTHLALAVADELGEEYADGAAVVSLAALVSADELVTAVAQGLGFQFYESAPPDQQLLDYLQGKQLLLVMDNCEHLLAGRGLLARMLAAAPLLKILATSRVRLQIQGEQLFPLDGLAFPDAKTAQGTGETVSEASHAAIALFMQSVRRLRPDFVRPSGHTDLNDIAHICALLRGMPLGILLASTWTEILSPREIACEIERNFQFLQAAGDGLPARHQSLEIVFRQSWHLLTAAEQAAFRRISVFRGGFTREAATAVAEAELSQLLGLASKHFLAAVPADRGATAVRYEVHELMRQFAGHELSQLPADEWATRLRHCAYYLALLGRRGEELKGSRQLEALAAIEADSGNMRVAWQWAVEEQLHERLDQALDGLGQYYEWRGYYEEGEAACREAVQRVAGTVSITGLQLTAKLLRWQARFSRYLGQRLAGIQLAQRGLELLNSPNLADQDVCSEQAATVLNLGELSADYAEGKKQFEHGLALAKSIGDPWRTAQASCLLGNRLANAPGSDAKGQELLEESLRLYQELGDRRSTLGVLKSMGFSAVLRGQLARGESLLRQSLAIAREMPGAIETLESMHSLAHGLVICGKYAEACEIAAEGMLLCQALGHRPWLARALGLTTNTQLGLGWYDSAYEQGLLGLAAAEEIGDPALASFALWRLGDIKLAQGQYAEAGLLLKRATETHRRLQILGRLSDVLASEGYAAYVLGQSHEIRSCLIETLQMSLDGRLWLTAIRSLPLAALYAVSRGRIETAVELYALASCTQYVANSPWFEDVAGRHVAAAAGSLPMEVVLSAQQRGRRRELWQAVEDLLETLLEEA